MHRAEIVTACTGSVFIVFNLFALEAFHVAEALRVPCVAVSPYIMPTSMPAIVKRQFARVLPALYALLMAGEEIERELKSVDDDTIESRLRAPPRLTWSCVEVRASGCFCGSVQRVCRLDPHWRLEISVPSLLGVSCSTGCGHCLTWSGGGSGARTCFEYPLCRTWTLCTVVRPHLRYRCCTPSVPASSLSQVPQNVEPIRVTLRAEALRPHRCTCITGGVCNVFGACGSVLASQRVRHRVWPVRRH